MENGPFEDVFPIQNVSLPEGIYLLIWQKNQPNLSKYTIPIDPMGDIREDHIGVCWRLKKILLVNLSPPPNVPQPQKQRLNKALLGCPRKIANG